MRDTLTKQLLACRSRGFTLIELLVVIGILTAIFALTALASSALSVAGRMQRREALIELGAGLEQATEEVRDAAGRVRTAVIWTLASRRIDREQAAELIRQFETADRHLADLLDQMEELKPRLDNDVDRQLLCDAIQTTRRLSAAIQRLLTALEGLVLLDMGQSLGME